MPPLRLVHRCYLLCVLVGPWIAPSGPAAQVASNMVLESRVPFDPCTTADVWGMGDYMLVARTWQGFSVVDLRAPRSPVVATIRPPGYPVAPNQLGISDIKSDGRYIYAGDNNGGHGVLIYDSQPDPMNPHLVSTLSSTGQVTKVHNLWVDGNYLYAQKKIFDITDKAAPRYVTEFSGFNLTHDVVVVDNRAYLANWLQGIAVFDVTNPLFPILLGSHSYPNALTHSVWPSEDRNYLYSTDERAGGVVRVWDISSLPTMTQVGQYKAGPPNAYVHNVFVRGDLLFVSYYREGVRVCSIKDPSRPVEIAYYDTYLPTTVGPCEMAGCWGVYPGRDDLVLATDVVSGGYILRLNPIAQTFKTPATTVSPGGTIQLDFAYRNFASAPLDSHALMLLTSFNGVPSPYLLLNESLLLAPQQAVARTVQLPIPFGLPTPLSVEFWTFTGLTSPPIVSALKTVTVLIN